MMRTSRKPTHVLLALFALAAMITATALAGQNTTTANQKDVAISTTIAAPDNLGTKVFDEATTALSATAYTGSFAMTGIASPPTEKTMAPKNTADNAESAAYMTTQTGFNNGAGMAGTKAAMKIAMANAAQVTAGFVITS